MTERIFPEHLCELLASGASRQTESSRVRSMERGTESGKEEQDKQSTRARKSKINRVWSNCEVGVEAERWWRM